jgi:hypothetical protein
MPSWIHLTIPCFQTLTPRNTSATPLLQTPVPNSSTLSQTTIYHPSSPPCPDRWMRSSNQTLPRSSKARRLCILISGNSTFNPHLRMLTPTASPSSAEALLYSATLWSSPPTRSHHGWGRPPGTVHGSTTSAWDCKTSKSQLSLPLQRHSSDRTPPCSTAPLMSAGPPW